MKKFIPFTMVLALGLFFCLPVVSAQTAQCKGCAHATPAVFSSTKNAASISGPPDSKGKPVEYQIFTQSKLDGSWKLETSGILDKPGTKQLFQYNNPPQIMVLVYCETPFANMVAFSKVKYAAPPSDH